MGRTAVPFHICFFMIAGINFLVKLMAWNCELNFHPYFTALDQTL
jgi:hypothetical protein